MVVQYRGVTGEKTESRQEVPVTHTPHSLKKTLKMELINSLNSRTEWHRLIKCLEVGFVCIHLLLPHTALTEQPRQRKSCLSLCCHSKCQRNHCQVDD